MLFETNSRRAGSSRPGSATSQANQPKLLLIDKQASHTLTSTDLGTIHVSIDENQSSIGSLREG